MEYGQVAVTMEIMVNYGHVTVTMEIMVNYGHVTVTMEIMVNYGHGLVIMGTLQHSSQLGTSHYVCNERTWLGNHGNPPTFITAGDFSLCL